MALWTPPAPGSLLGFKSPEPPKASETGGVILAGTTDHEEDDAEPEPVPGIPSAEDERAREGAKLGPRGTLPTATAEGEGAEGSRAEGFSVPRAPGVPTTREAAMGTGDVGSSIATSGDTRDGSTPSPWFDPWTGVVGTRAMGPVATCVGSTGSPGPRRRPGAEDDAWTGPDDDNDEEDADDDDDDDAVVDVVEAVVG